jgi:O-antigen/teichoic acid export membrane protein
MLAFSLPLVFSSVFLAVSSSTDRIAINAVLGRDDVGVYGIGSRVATTVALVIAAFSYALEPLVLARHREPGTPAEIARLMRIFLILILPLVLGLGLFAPEIVRLLVTPDYYASADVIAPLALATVLTGMTMFAPGLSIARRTRLIAIVVIATSALNVFFNVLLIPRFGVPGAAMATVLSAGVVFATGLVSSQMFYRVPHSAARLSAAAGIAAFGIAAGFALASVTIGTIALIAIKSAVWTVSCAALALALLDRRDLRILRDRVRRTGLLRGGRDVAP